VPPEAVLQPQTLDLIASVSVAAHILGQVVHQLLSFPLFLLLWGHFVADDLLVDQASIESGLTGQLHHFTPIYKLRALVRIVQIYRFLHHVKFHPVSLDRGLTWELTLTAIRCLLIIKF
jgi:hypothetical protein